MDQPDHDLRDLGRARLTEWADFRLALDAAQAKARAEGVRVGRVADPKVEERALETDRAVFALPRALRDAVEAKYLGTGPVAEAARAHGVARGDLDMAEAVARPALEAEALVGEQLRRAEDLAGLARLIGAARDDTDGTDGANGDDARLAAIGRERLAEWARERVTAEDVGWSGVSATEQARVRAHGGGASTAPGRFSTLELDAMAHGRTLQTEGAVRDLPVRQREAIEAKYLGRTTLKTWARARGLTDNAAYAAVKRGTRGVGEVLMGMRKPVAPATRAEGVAVLVARAERRVRLQAERPSGWKPRPCPALAGRPRYLASVDESLGRRTAERPLLNLRFTKRAATG